MSSAKRLILLLCLTGILVSTAEKPCNASTIAVLPVENLSLGANGLSLTMTQTLAEVLTDKGFKVSHQDEVISFMVKNRVRWLGSLSSPYIRRLHSQLQVDYLLIGSISQQQIAPPFAINLNLQLIRTKDCKIVWSATTEQSDINKVSLLDLSKQRELTEIEQLTAAEALSTIPIEASSQQKLTLQAHIESVQLRPKIVKPGGKITCQIKLSTDSDNPAKTTVVLYAGQEIINAQYDSQAKAYKASWLSAPENQQQTVTAVISKDGQTSREIILGNYRIDGDPPKVKLLVRGQEIDGLVILQKQVTIIPSLQTPEQITRWHLTIRDAEGKSVVSETGYKQLPPQFSWWGQGQNGNQVKDGFYAVELSLWDRAGNQASSQESIRVFRTKPQMTLAMEKQPNTLAVALNYAGEIPLAYWRLQVRDKKGTIIIERSGSEESNKILLPLKMADQNSLSYRVYAQDMLGNHLQKDMTLMTKGRKNKNKEDNSNFLASIEGQKMATEEVWAEDF